METKMQFSEIEDRLYDYFNNHEMSHISHQVRSDLARFFLLLKEHQKNQNLTRIVKFKDVVIKHFIDSLIIAKLYPLKFPLLDVGSGAGFPGVPLKILVPSEKIILAEGVAKRVKFLKIVREKLNLSNLDIIGRNIEEDFTYPVQGVITRAVEPMMMTLKNIQNALVPGGQMYFMKGPQCQEELDQAQNLLKDKFKLILNLPYEIPKTPHQRRLVIFERLENNLTYENQ